jgi:hypothetical protein
MSPLDELAEEEWDLVLDTKPQGHVSRDAGDRTGDRG